MTGDLHRDRAIAQSKPLTTTTRVHSAGEAVTGSSLLETPRRTSSRLASGNHAAPDAVAGVPGWIALHVVWFGVDDQGRATGGQRIRTRAELDVGVDEGRLRRAIRRNGHIVHVACVRTLRVFQPVLLARGIEMRPADSNEGASHVGVWCR